MIIGWTMTCASGSPMSCGQFPDLPEGLLHGRPVLKVKDHPSLLQLMNNPLRIYLQYYRISDIFGACIASSSFCVFLVVTSGIP